MLLYPYGEHTSALPVIAYPSIQDLRAVTLAYTPSTSQYADPNDTTPIWTWWSPSDVINGPPESPMQAPLPAPSPAQIMVLSILSDPYTYSQTVLVTTGMSTSISTRDWLPLLVVPNPVTVASAPAKESDVVGRQMGLIWVVMKSTFQDNSKRDIS